MDNRLQATPTQEGMSGALYSWRAQLFVAFFGGAMSAVLFSGLNSYLLKRLRTELVFYGIAVIVLFGFYLWILVPPEGVTGLQWLGAYRRENVVFRYGPRIIALLVWAAGYALHRPFLLQMRERGLEALNPWRAGIVCFVVGGICQLLMIQAAIQIKQGQ